MAAKVKLDVPNAPMYVGSYAYVRVRIPAASGLAIEDLAKDAWGWPATAGSTGLGSSSHIRSGPAPVGLPIDGKCRWIDAEYLPVPGLGECRSPRIPCNGKKKVSVKP